MKKIYKTLLMTLLGLFLSLPIMAGNGQEPPQEPIAEDANQSDPSAPTSFVTPYQGKLVNKNNEPLTGTYNVTFAFYSTEGSVAALWREEHFGAHAVIARDGLFSVALGELTIFQDYLFGTPLYLGIQIQGKDELRPRIQFATLPFAMRTNSAPDTLKLGGYLHTDYLKMGETITSLSIDKPRVITLNVGTISNAGTLYISQTLRARKIVGNGAQSKNWDAGNFSSGVIALNKGGLGTTSAKQARLNLELPLLNLSVGTIVSANTLRAAQLRASYQNQSTTLNSVAFKNYFSFSDIENPELFKRNLELNKLTQKSGDILTGPLSIQPTSKVGVVIMSGNQAKLGLLSTGEVYGYKLTLRNMITPALAIGSSMVNNLAFEDSVSILNFDSVESAKQILSLQGIASQSIFPSSNYDIGLFSSALQLGALATLERANPENISLTSIKQALDLKKLATQNIVPTAAFALSELKTAFRLGELAELSVAAPYYFNLNPQLMLGDLATKSVVQGSDIVRQDWIDMLNLKELAFMNRIAPQSVNIPALKEALHLGEVAGMQTLPLNRLNLSDVSEALELKDLARLDTISTPNFRNLELFKSEGLLLGNLAYAEKLNEDYFEPTISSNGLGLGALAKANYISTANIANLKAFQQTLELGGLAYRPNFTYRDIEKFEDSFSDLKLGTLAQRSRLETKDVVLTAENLELNQYLEKTGGTLRGTYQFVERGSILMTDEKLNTLRLSGSGFSTPIITVDNAMHFPAQTIVQTGLFNTVLTPRIYSGENLLEIRALTMSSDGIQLDSQVNLKRGSSWLYWWHNNNGIMYETGANRRVDLSPGRTGFYDWNTIETDQHIGLSLDAWRERDVNEQLVSLGAGSGAQLRLDVRNTNAPQAFIKLNTATLEIGKNAFNLAANLTQSIRSDQDGTIELRMDSGSLTLRPDGKISNAQKLTKSLELVTKETPTINGTLEMKNSILAFKNTHTLLTPTSTRIPTISVTNELTLFHLVLNGEEKHFGNLAFLNRVNNDEFLRLLVEKVDFNTFIPDRGGFFLTGEYKVAHSGKIVMKNDTGRHGILSATGNILSELKVGADSLSATNPFLSNLLVTEKLTAESLTVNRVMTIPSVLLLNKNALIYDEIELHLKKSLMIGGELSPTMHVGTVDSIFAGISYAPAVGSINRIVVGASKSKSQFAFFENNRQQSVIQWNTEVNTATLEIIANTFNLGPVGNGNANRTMAVNEKKITIVNSIVQLMRTSGSSGIIDLSSSGIRLAAGFPLQNAAQTSYPTLNATLFKGRGSGINRINVANITVGVIPIANGGIGGTSLNAFIHTVDVIPNNMTVGTMDVTTTVTIPTFKGVTVNGVPRLTLDTQVSLNQKIAFLSTAKFKKLITFNKVTFKQTEMIATQTIEQDVKIMSAGRSTYSWPTLYTVNLENAQELSAYDYHTLVFDYATVGAPAATIQSFGSSPTMRANHYSPSGSAFIAVVGGGSGNYGAPMQITEMAFNEEAALKAIHNGEGQGIYAKASSGKSTIMATNLGSGVAFEARSNGFLPAITASSLGDTAIFALGNIQMSSSKRWKRDITPLQDSLEKVLRLQGVSYIRTDKKSQNTHIGFIAEDVGKEFPELVDYEKNGIDAIGLAYDNLTAVLVEALKEQHQQVVTLEANIAALKEKQKILKEQAPNLAQEIAKLKSGTP